MASFAAGGGTAAVEAILGFNTSEFLLEVSDAVERALVVGVGEMQRELKALAAQKGYKTVTDAKLGEACQRLLESMRRHFSKNMSKFELYASRNIFSLPVQDKVTEGSSGSAVEQAEIDELKRRYSELQDQHARLAGEVRDGDSLVRDMRSAMFAIRVACQTLNDHPLADTMASLNTQQSTLKTLIKRARELADEIDGSPKSSDSDGAASGAASGSSPEKKGGGAIKTAGAADSAKLAASIQKHA